MRARTFSRHNSTNSRALADCSGTILARTSSGNSRVAWPDKWKATLLCVRFAVFRTRNTFWNMSKYDCQIKTAHTACSAWIEGSIPRSHSRMRQSSASLIPNQKLQNTNCTVLRLTPNVFMINTGNGSISEHLTCFTMATWLVYNLLWAMKHGFRNIS